MKRIVGEVVWGILHCFVAVVALCITYFVWWLFWLPGIAIAVVCLLVALFIPAPRAKSLAIAALIGCALCIPWMMFSTH